MKITECWSTMVTIQRFEPKSRTYAKNFHGKRVNRHPFATAPVCLSHCRRAAKFPIFRYAKFEIQFAPNRNDNRPRCKTRRRTFTPRTLWIHSNERCGLCPRCPRIGHWARSDNIRGRERIVYTRETRSVVGPERKREAFGISHGVDPTIDTMTLSSSGPMRIRRCLGCISPLIRKEHRTLVVPLFLVPASSSPFSLSCMRRVLVFFELSFWLGRSCFPPPLSHFSLPPYLLLWRGIW